MAAGLYYRYHRRVSGQAFQRRRRSRISRTQKEHKVKIFKIQWVFVYKLITWTIKKISGLSRDLPDQVEISNALILYILGTVITGRLYESFTLF